MHLEGTRGHCYNHPLLQTSSVELPDKPILLIPKKPPTYTKSHSVQLPQWPRGYSITHEHAPLKALSNLWEFPCVFTEPPATYSFTLVSLPNSQTHLQWYCLLLPSCLLWRKGPIQSEAKTPTMAMDLTHFSVFRTRAQLLNV